MKLINFKMNSKTNKRFIQDFLIKVGIEFTFFFICLIQDAAESKCVLVKLKSYQWAFKLSKIFHVNNLTVSVQSSFKK